MNTAELKGSARSRGLTFLAGTLPHFVPKLNDFGRYGRAYSETSEERADLETTITDLITGQYDRPVRVVAFNTAEGWSADVSEDIAREIMRRVDLAGDELSAALESFVDQHVGSDRQLTLRLA